MRVDLEESPEVLRYLQSLDARRAAIVWSQLFVVRETPFLIQQLFLMRWSRAASSAFQCGRPERSSYRGPRLRRSTYHQSENGHPWALETADASRHSSRFHQPEC